MRAAVRRSVYFALDTSAAQPRIENNKMFQRIGRVGRRSSHSIARAKNCSHEKLRVLVSDNFFQSIARTKSWRLGQNVYEARHLNEALSDVFRKNSSCIVYDWAMCSVCVVCSSPYFETLQSAIEWWTLDEQRDPNVISTLSPITCARIVSKWQTIVVRPSSITFYHRMWIVYHDCSECSLVKWVQSSLSPFDWHRKKRS